MKKKAAEKEIALHPPCRFCPGCGYAITQLEIESSRFDYDCPHCRKHKHSEFKQEGK